MECPEGQEFSTTEAKCDSPDVAQCDPCKKQVLISRKSSCKVLLSDFSTTTGLTTNTTGTTETRI
jgi:hypothetical protein